MTTRSLLLLMTGTLAAVLAMACAGTDATGDTGITLTPGTWSYTLTEGIPLPAGTQPRCTASGSGTTTVSSTGTYAIQFPALSCSGCTMSATASGTLGGTTINGIVSASIAGSGCSNEQPTPHPAPATGRCTSTSCTAQTADGDSFALSFTLTPG